LIDDDEVERALDYLRDNAGAAAEARAHRLYCEEYRKSLKAILMKEHDLAVNGQEREAYADERYIKFLEGLKAAVYEDERHRFLLSAAEAKIEAWRTMSATERANKL
jgi:hypothetical protein